MCLYHRQLDSTTRRIVAAGHLCLWTGVMFSTLQHGFRQHHALLANSLEFLLLGCAIGLLYWASRRSGGCTVNPERNSHVSA